MTPPLAGENMVAVSNDFDRMRLALRYVLPAVLFDLALRGFHAALPPAAAEARKERRRLWRLLCAMPFALTNAPTPSVDDDTGADIVQKVRASVSGRRNDIRDMHLLLSNHIDRAGRLKDRRTAGELAAALVREFGWDLEARGPTPFDDWIGLHDRRGILARILARYDPAAGDTLNEARREVDKALGPARKRPGVNPPGAG